MFVCLNHPQRRNGLYCLEYKYIYLSIYLSLEKRNACRKSIAALKINDQLITRTSAILEVLRADLFTKYNKTHEIPNSIDEFIQRNVRVTLSDHEISDLELPLSYEELTAAVNDTKKGKSPGSNGYVSLFSKYFWKRLGPFLFRAFRHCFKMNTMLESHREGIITIIPKDAKSENIKAWRPITLLNVDFKIISSAMASRLKRVLGKLTDSCQIAYIKGRYIGENTRLVYDVISYLSETNGKGLILSADFEAAFNSLSWDFVSERLKAINLGRNLEAC